jgi:hypothetical protein
MWSSMRHVTYLRTYLGILHSVMVHLYLICMLFMLVKFKSAQYMIITFLCFKKNKILILRHQILFYYKQFIFLQSTSVMFHLLCTIYEPRFCYVSLLKVYTPYVMCNCIFRLKHFLSSSTYLRFLLLITLVLLWQT